MTATVATATPIRLSVPGRDRAVVAMGIAAGALIATAFFRRLASGLPLFGHASPWLVLHLAAVVPAMPIGLWLLTRPAKGDRLHRLLGRLWCVLMMATALSSFGLTGLMGRLSPIHLLSVLVLAGVPRAILAAVRGDIAGHRRGMTIMVASTAVAGFFTFLPGRLLGAWLFG